MFDSAPKKIFDAKISSTVALTDLFSFTAGQYLAFSITSPPESKYIKIAFKISETGYKENV
jgi:hypothetical protein